MKPNPQYDETVRGSVKYVRHTAIAHSSVLVYNVKTLLDKYVHASGTRAAHAPLCYLASSQQQPFLPSPTVPSFHSPLYASGSG